MINVDKEVKKSEDLVRRWTENDRANWVTQAHESRKFKIGSQWEKTDAEALKANNQPALVENEVLPAINLIVAQLTENNPRFFAVGREGSDFKEASHVADLLQYIWYVSKGNVRAKKVITDYEDIGMGAWMVYVDPYADWGKGEIKITDVDPIELIIDPNSKEPDSSDASSIMIRKRLTEEQIKLHYPSFSLEGAIKGSLIDYPSDTLDDPQDQVIYPEDDSDYYEVIDRYTKVKVPMFNVYDPQSDEERLLTNDEYIEYGKELAAIISRQGLPDQFITDRKGVEIVRQTITQYGNVFHLMIDPYTGESYKMSGVEHEHPLVIQGSTTRMQIVYKAQLINEAQITVDKVNVDRIKRVFSIGRKKLSESIMPISNYPIVTVMLHHNRNPFPMGDINLVKDLQKQLNKINSLIIAYNTNITNVKYWIPKGSQDKKRLEERIGKAGAQVFEYDPELGGAPIVVQLTQMSVALYQEKEMITQRIQRIIGAYAFQDGNVQQAPQTKGGTVLLDEFMQRRVMMKKRDIEESLNQLAKVIVELIPHVYTERKVIRIVLPNRKPKEVIFNDQQIDDRGVVNIYNDLSSGKYDVQVISGSMLPSNKMMQREEIKEAFINGILRDPTPYIKLLDLPDVDEVLEREDRLAQAQAQLQQASEYIKNLEGDMQTKDRELVHADRQVEKEKFKADLARAGAKVESAVEITKSKLKEVEKNGSNKGKKDN